MSSFDRILTKRMPNRAHPKPVPATSGRLVVLERAGSADNGDALYKVICCCPLQSAFLVRGQALRSGNTRSCGCLRSEAGTRQANANNARRRTA